MEMVKAIVAKKIRIEEALALSASGIVWAINILTYENTLQFSRAAALMLRYFSFGDPFYGLFFGFIYFFFLAKFYLYIVKVVSEKIIKKKTIPKGAARQLVFYFLEPLRIVIPLALVALSFYTLLGNMSLELRFSGRDIMFWRIDEIVFGSNSFIWLPTYIAADTLRVLLQYAYFSLPVVMSVTLATLFYASRQNLFRKAIISFMLSLIVAFPFFYAFPCQDPNNFFLSNIRNNSFPEDISRTLVAYSPSIETKKIIERISNAEADEENDNAVPISCFPSMHATWSFFIVYFLFRLRKWTLFVTLPWTILLLLGGLYFAQHYAIDYLVAIPVAAASIFLAGLLLRLEIWYKGKTIAKP